MPCDKIRCFFLDVLYRTDVADKLDADAVVLQLLAILDTDLDLSNQLNKQRYLRVRNFIVVSPQKDIIVGFTRQRTFPATVSPSK